MNETGVSVFKQMWNEYERVVIKSLLTTFGLDLFIKDIDGGDVDTIHNIRESQKDGNIVFKNSSYQQAYDNRGNYDTGAYHRHPAFREMKSEARRIYNSTGEPIVDAYDSDNYLHFTKSSGVSTWHRANLDHVISANEIHNDPARILSGLDGPDLANNEFNLRFTSESLNKKMRDLPIEEFIAWCEENPDKVNYGGVEGCALPEEVKEKLREEDRRARQAYNELLEIEYYTSPQFYIDASKAAALRGVQMGARQVIGFVFIEFWIECKKELSKLEAGCSFSDCLKSIQIGLANGLTSCKAKYEDILLQFGEGFLSGVLASFTTTLINVFITTDANQIRYIRQIYASVVECGGVLLINPNELRLGEQIKVSTSILVTCASSLAGLAVGNLLDKTPIVAIPVVGKSIKTFTSVLVSGLISCSLLILLDCSKFYNSVILKLNEYTSPTGKAHEEYLAYVECAAEIAKIDISDFVKEVDKYNNYADLIYKNLYSDDLDVLLLSIYVALDVTVPWDGDFDDFMDNPQNRLIYD